MFKLKILALAAAVAVAGTGVSAESWTLNSDGSHIAFGSVKKDTVGEIHSFGDVSGNVTQDGAVTVEIGLASVETLIDIRNERMQEFVFGGTPKATINASIDMAEVSALGVGQGAVVDATGTVSLVGNTLELDTEMFVIRVSDTQVMVTTNDMIMLSMADMGLTAGIDKLMELAKLPGITRVSPVTMRLMFDQAQSTAAATPVAEAEVVQAAVTGDVKNGKKVFRKCKACHQLKEGKNGVGPSLYNVVGRDAGALDGFKYSKPMAAAGIVWTPENLTGYLADPKGFMPGNKMAFRGLRKEADIADVIAYIASES